MRFLPFSELPRPKVTERNLPHWETPGATYFITFRLKDSMPAGVLGELESVRAGWLRAHGLSHRQEVARLPKEQRREFHRMFTALEERWLNQGHGACVLRREQLRQDTESGLRFFDGKRYAMDAFVIMPNHVHVLILPHEGWTLSRIISTWKKNSAREINGRLGQEGALWQKESYDHIVRDLEQLEAFRRYVANNPAKLRAGEYTLGKGSGIEA
jgi:putative transposase